MATTDAINSHWIYKLTCLPTGKSYIGMTKNRARRLVEHTNNSSGKKLRAAIELYGIEEFTYTIVCECASRDEAKKRERYEIKQQGTVWPDGYNLIGGGRGTLAAAASAASKARRSAAQKRFWADPANRVIVSERVSEFWSRPENAIVLSNRMKARWADPVYRERMSGAHWSRKQSDETRALISRKAKERAAAKRAQGAEVDYTALRAGTRASWENPAKWAARMASIKAYWDSPKGQQQKELNRWIRLERNRELWQDPVFVEKFRKAKAEQVVTEETRRKMSESAKNRVKRDATLS